jgi:hypothetical protein
MEKRYLRRHSTSPDKGKYAMAERREKMGRYQLSHALLVTSANAHSPF